MTKTLFCPLVRSIIEYGVIVWFLSYTTTEACLVERVDTILFVYSLYLSVGSN